MFKVTEKPVMVVIKHLTGEKSKKSGKPYTVTELQDVHTMEILTSYKEQFSAWTAFAEGSVVECEVEFVAWSKPLLLVPTTLRTDVTFGLKKA